MSGQFPDLDADVREVDAETLKQRLDDGESITILDTRRPEDFEAWHITHPNLTAVNVPFTEFLDGDDPADDVPEDVPDGPLVTCCAKGISSLYVAEFLAREGWDIVALQNGMEGWARLYERREVPADGPATVYQYHRPSSGCLAYLVVADGEAAVVDPLRTFTDRYVDDVRELGATLRYALDTHVHADHVSGVRRLARETDATAVVPAGAVERGFDAPTYETVGDGDSLPLGDAAIEAVGIPGHTTEMTGYRVDGVFVTGDTVFRDSVARPDLERGTEGAADAARTLHETLGDLAAMDDDLLVAPGHTSPDERPADDGTYTNRLGDLRDSLAAFGMDREAFVEAIVSDMPPRPNNYEDIIATNLGQQDVGDDEAFELELGPNNCAASSAAD